jgi:hypothetical protein
MALPANGFRRGSGRRIRAACSGINSINQRRHAVIAFEAFLATLPEESIVGDAALASSEAHAQAFWAVRDAPG